MADLLPFPKPKDLEGKITLSPAQRAHKRKQLFITQRGLCAICGCRMSWEPIYPFGASLDHKIPEPKGCAKRDNDDNLQVVCMKCNGQKGSRRDYQNARW